MTIHGLAERHACRLLGIDPKTMRRPNPKDELEIRERARVIAAARRRFD